MDLLEDCEAEGDYRSLLWETKEYGCLATAKLH